MRAEKPYWRTPSAPGASFDSRFQFDPSGGSMIPHEKSAAVSRGLREAFGTTAIEDIRTMPKGLSSDLVFRIIVQGSPFLLKIMTRIDERNAPQRIFSAMKAEAEAGLSPRSWHANSEAGISIMKFVETGPFPVTDALVRFPG